MTEAEARKILGVDASDDWDTIVEQFRQRAHETHPDTTGQPDPTMFILCRAAFETLREHAARGDRRAYAKGADADSLGSDPSWKKEEDRIRRAFAELRKTYRGMDVSAQLCARLAELVEGYATRREMEKRLAREAQAVVASFVASLHARLEREIRRIDRSIVRELFDGYAIFYERVRLLRTRRRLFTLSSFLATLGSGIVMVPAAITITRPDLVTGTAVGLLGSVMTGQLFDLAYRGRPLAPRSNIQPRGLTGFGDVEATKIGTKGEGAAFGASLLLLDLIDGDFEALGVVGLVIAGLAALFAPSLDKVKQKVIAQLEEQVREKLQLEHRIDECIRQAEAHVLAQAREDFELRARRAIELAMQYPALAYQPPGDISPDAARRAEAVGRRRAVLSFLLGVALLAAAAAWAGVTWMRP